MTDERLKQLNEMQANIQKHINIVDLLGEFSTQPTLTLFHKDIGELYISGELKDHVIDYIRGIYQSQLDTLRETFNDL